MRGKARRADQSHESGDSGNESKGNGVSHAQRGDRSKRSPLKICGAVGKEKSARRTIYKIILKE